MVYGHNPDTMCIEDKYDYAEEGPSRKYGNRQARRIEKAIDELIKIQDDGKASSNIQHILDMLNSELSKYY